MRCLSCGRDTMHESTTAYFEQLSNCYVIIENVPCKKCDECGEVFFDMAAMDKIQTILKKAEAAASKIFIFDYEQAA